MTETREAYTVPGTTPAPDPVEEAEALVAAASAGPWRWEQSMNFPESWPGNASGTFTFKIIAGGDNPVLYLPMQYALVDKKQTKANARLIAAAPRLLRDLVAEVRRLEAELAECREGKDG